MVFSVEKEREEFVQDTLPEVRQSSFAVLGDLVKHCYPIVAPHVREYFSSFFFPFHVSYCSFFR